MDITDRFEFATDQDPARNYCLWDYSRSVPAADKFRSVNLLYQSFALAGMDERGCRIVDAIRDEIGDFRTVFGVKLLPDHRLAWEFYFYDYARRQRAVSISRLIGALAALVRCDVRPVESLPYFMFSLDIDLPLARAERALDVVHMYVGNPGSSVSSGIAYALRADSTTLENFYFFFDARTELQAVADKVSASAVVDVTRIALDEVLVPELRACQTICVANKQTHDCIYFSGIDVDQLVFFLRRYAYPRETVEFVEFHRSKLDHLRFDVGVDYWMSGGRLEILKSGYYGVF